MHTLSRKKTNQTESQSFGIIRKAERKGQAVVQLAIAGLIMVSVTLGAVDFGRALYTYAELSHAVRDGAEFANSNPSATEAIELRIREQASSLDGTDGGPSRLTVDQPRCTAERESGCSAITVSASYAFSPFTMDILGLGKITFRASAQTDSE